MMSFLVIETSRLYQIHVLFCYLQNDIYTKVKWKKKCTHYRFVQELFKVLHSNWEFQCENTTHSSKI